MAKRGRPSDDRLREFAEEHLDYEVAMIAGLVEHFRKIGAAIAASGHGEPDVPDLVTRNAHVESFAIHARTLLEFFYRKEPDPRFPDDAFAGDFFDDPDEWKRLRPPKTALLSDAWTRVGTDLAHLSYARLDRGDKSWFIDLWYDLATVVRAFAENAHADRLPADARERILGHLPTSAVDRPTLGVTTTASMSTALVIDPLLLDDPAHERSRAEARSQTGDAESDVETFTCGSTTLEVGLDGIKDRDHFVPYTQLRSVDKHGGKWLGHDLELVWGNKGAWASDHSSGHRFGFGDDVESRDRAYDLIVSRVAAVQRHSQD
jgi:hypothetical protein